MDGFLGYLVQGEDGFASAWSIMHFLSGMVPHALYAWFVEADAWISLFVLAVAACVFELVENTPGMGRIMWTWIGYTTENYRIDSLQNAVSDVLFLLGGWFVAQIVHLLSSSLTAFGVLMGVAGALFLLFLWLFSRERAQWLVAKQAASTVPVALVGGAATGGALVGGARSGPRPSVRFVL